MSASIERIQRETAALHARAAGTGYAQAILEGSVPLSHYARFLRALHIVHVSLEQALRAQAGPSEVQAALSARRALLEADLVFLTAARHLDEQAVDRASLHALVLGQQIRLTSATTPAALWGHLYVVEGSQLGGVVQARGLARHPELTHDGLRYLQNAGPHTPAAFEASLVQLERALAADEPALAAAVAAAQRCFEGVLAILEALDPRRTAGAEDSDRLLRALNPEAGSHALPSDSREVHASFRADEQSHRAHGYYRARYGDCGLRYTRSNSAWLATLARGSGQSAVEQVAWLGHVLAVRGMPTLLLREHLHVLHEALHAVPERASSYAKLLDAADALPTAPESPVPVDVQALAAEHDLSADEAFRLVQAAISDERAGYGGALRSLMAFVADPQQLQRDLDPGHAVRSGGG